MAEKPNTKPAAEEKIYSAADVRELIETTKNLSVELGKMKAYLADGAGERSKIVTEIKTRTATVMFIDGKAVVGLVNKGSDKRPVHLYDKPDANRKGEYFLYADIILQGEEKATSLDWNEFLQHADRAECKIVSVEDIPWEIIQGETMKRVIDTDYKIEVDAPVDVVVRGVNKLMTMQLPDGSQVKIDAQYLNMSK